MEWRLKDRRGITLSELAVALVVLLAAMAAMVQLMAATAGQRRLVEQRRIALEEIANQAERVAMLPWEQTSPEALTTWEPSAELTAAIDRAVCTAEVTEETEAPRARRIRLVVTWPNAAGQPVEPASVTLWKFAPGGPP